MMRRAATSLAAAALLLAPAAIANAAQSGHGAVVRARACAHGCHRIVRRYRSGVEVHSFNFPVVSPRDAASGHATGRRMHKPIVH
jgi:hypothetical protein